MPDDLRRSMHLALGLVELFDLRALERLLWRLGDPGQSIIQAVTWRDGLTHAAFAVAEALEQRGLVGPPLFDALLEERPLRAARLEDLARTLGVDWSPTEERRAEQDQLLQLSLLLRDVVPPESLREGLERVGTAGRAVARDVAWEAGHSQATFEVARLLVQQGLVTRALFLVLREGLPYPAARRLVEVAALFGVHGLTPPGIPSGTRAWRRLGLQVCGAGLLFATLGGLGHRVLSPPLQPIVLVDGHPWTDRTVPGQARVTCGVNGLRRARVRWIRQGDVRSGDPEGAEVSLGGQPGERWICTARDPWMLRSAGEVRVLINRPPLVAEPQVEVDGALVMCTVSVAAGLEVGLTWSLLAAGGRTFDRAPERDERFEDGRKRRTDRLPPGAWLCRARVVDPVGDVSEGRRQHVVPCRAALSGVPAGAAPTRGAGGDVTWGPPGPGVIQVALNSEDTAGGAWRRWLMIDGTDAPLWEQTGPRKNGGAVTRAEVVAARQAWARRLDPPTWSEIERRLAGYCHDLALSATSSEGAR